MHRLLIACFITLLTTEMSFTSQASGEDIYSTAKVSTPSESSAPGTITKGTVLSKKGVAPATTISKSENPAIPQPNTVNTVIAKDIGPVTKLPIPRFVSLKTSEVCLRSGPGQKYPSKFIYKCAHYPVEIISEFETWRMVRDRSGHEGWIHESILSGRRSVIISGHNTVIHRYPGLDRDETLLFRIPSISSRPIARLTIGSLAKLVGCKNRWCKVKTHSGKVGWLPSDDLWGIYPEEIK